MTDHLVNIQCIQQWVCILRAVENLSICQPKITYLGETCCEDNNFKVPSCDAHEFIAARALQDIDLMDKAFNFDRDNVVWISNWFKRTMYKGFVQVEYETRLSCVLWLLRRKESL